MDVLGDTRLAPLLPTLKSAAPVRTGPVTAEPQGPQDTFTAGHAPAAGTTQQYPWENEQPAAPTPSPELALRLPDPEEALPSLAEARKRDKEYGLALRDLKARRKELKDGPLAEAAEVHQQLVQTQAARENIQAVARQMRWEKSGGGELSPLEQTYFQTSDVPVSEMQEVARITRSLEQPDSPYKLKGNQVEALTREEIWHKKMELLDGAVQNPVRNGEPVEVEAQYYEMASPEMLEKLSRASRGGANVRMLLDSGTLSKQGEELDATSLTARLNATRRLEVGSQGRAAVQFFANKEVLGARAEIMHRKLLRVGDETVFGGMNSNAGSSENVDFATTIRGPAAAKLSQGFQRDVELSAGRGVEEIYGNQLEELRTSELPVKVQRRGLLDLLEAQTGVPPRGGMTQAERVDRAIESAGYQGVTIGQLAEIPDADGDGKVSPADERAFLLEGRGGVTLTDRGRNLLADGLEQAVGRMNAPGNMQKLQTSRLPSEAATGADTVAVGDTAAERQALILHSIDSADKFVKVSAFVLNADMARLLADKRDRMQAEGKPFEVQVVLDPGMYQYGGTPNEKSFKMLEDRGVPVRWAVLDRTDGDHDRKVHAKMILTDKMMLTGSTNFSHKGLRDNWEMSDLTFFDDGPDSAAKLQEVNGDFDRLWNRESLALDTRALAQQRYGDREGAEGEMLRDSYRSRVTRSFLRGIQAYEEDVGARVQEQVKQNPQLRYQIEEQVRNGFPRGYATMEALGEERMAELRESSPAYQRLLRIQTEGAGVR